MSVRRNQISDSSQKEMECLREQALQGHLRDATCDEKDCQYRLVETQCFGANTESKTEGDCLLQLTSSSY